ncbi:IS30 family transposase [Lachnospiraceae bacterium Oil+RF-744-WCA-WT-11]|uniref:IS30 family transposase n=1 Tax=Porcincola intestinalis TaxID=2606632 RepID=A0A6L5X5U0_9FIRM|nr:IS30 family transposase [Porcincola intestinalis]
MSKEIIGNGKHFTLDDRSALQAGLDQKKSFRAIAKELHKDPSTLAKEVKLNRTAYGRCFYTNSFGNLCKYARLCKKTNLCHNRAKCKASLCYRCRIHDRRRICPDFVKFDHICPATEKAPFVRNSCSKFNRCDCFRFKYKATAAQSSYEDRLRDTRTGIDMTAERLALLDQIVTPRIKKGDSPQTIIRNNPGLKVSSRTIYNYVDQGLLSVKNLDLPKKVVYKPRVKKKDYPVKDSGIFNGRTYNDFLELVRNDPERAAKTVEMDTVVGCEGSKKVILTLFFRPYKLQLLFLMPDKTALSVKTVFDRIEDKLTPIGFQQAFPVILTDRGSEFSDPDSLETGIQSEMRTSIYYCDPMCSNQKAYCERNHECIRKVLLKKSSFDSLTCYDIRKLCWHINSTKRASLNGQSPIKLASLLLPKEIFEALDLREIPCNEINLTPTLLK